MLEERGGAVVLLEPQCSGKLLYDTTCQLLADQEKLESMAQGLRELQTGDASEQIYQTLFGLIRR